MQYDDTIRNSEKTVVQFVYGDDGLNPQSMEISKKMELRGVGTVDVALPADFNEIMRHVVASGPCLDELPLSPEGIVAVGMKVRVEILLLITTRKIVMNNNTPNLEDSSTALLCPIDVQGSK